ncbi:low-density lipoprotein receptor-related protein 2 isoform X2 [Girardinichthys multiradiatus]|uniref:low-density lipoprotein receptor-related protein 2 isoform X2 n=1 Tax=Girardinichthys multiradiatus TaxID=208333 RepID=UPI001FAE40F7|nr:low-density lipoprotein receptor-related protein 2 isoform X2 [Girardinichthys multiradiatus]
MVFVRLSRGVDMDLRLVIWLIFLPSLKCSSGQVLVCHKDQWQCDDGHCITAAWRCDGEGDCLDGSDEMGCAASTDPDCPPGQFPCLDSVGCVDVSARCDGQNQCPTGSDEENCPATEGCLDSEWMCGNRICIPMELRCDGQNDCMDNSDEDKCGKCSEDGLRCPDGKCLLAEDRCDGQFQCSDGSDEPITCGRICSRYNGGCSHVCTDESWGVRCVCPVGYKLSSNGAVCEDLDECASPFPPCAHYCTNTIGSYYCHCREGFKLNRDATCQALGNATQLLMVQRNTLGLLNVKSEQFKAIKASVFDPVALTYDITSGWYYWADNGGSIYKTNGQNSWRTFTGEPGIKGLACDWLNGYLFWTNQKTESIYMQSSDGKSFTTLLNKNASPSELVLLPIESLMFWINEGPGDRVTLDKSWMDGSDRSPLAVLTAQFAHSLTADVPARRLYWISDAKRSVETVRADGTGRYSFTGFFDKRPALSLTVFESMFFWTDEKGLWQVPQEKAYPRKLIMKTDLPLLSVYHELQQPKGSSACAKTPCLLCQLTKNNPAGFTCACPYFKVLLPDGTCKYPRFLYGSVTTISLLEFRGKESSKMALFSSDEGIVSFDVDWYREWLYWANRTGHIQRTSLTLDRTEFIPTPLPVCLLSVDQRSGNLFWVSCDQNIIGTSGASSNYPQQLYRTTKEIGSFYLDWLRGGMFWLEEGWIFSMGIMGGKAKELLQIGVSGNIAFDLRASSLLWNSKRAGLTTLSLLKERSHQAGRRWNISGSVVAAFEPFLLSISNNVITLWDRRDGNKIQSVSVKDPVLSVVIALGEIQKVPDTPVCAAPSWLCRDSSVCLPQNLLCDGKRDCPDGDDEEFCVGACPEEDFKCKDRRNCIPRSLLCDGRAHCHDGSDEVDCPTVAAPESQTSVLKCHSGSMLCKDGTECVLYSHVCDGEADCMDRSDELGCDAIQELTSSTKRNEKLPVTKPPVLTLPACFSPSSLCPSSTAYVCISQSQFCDGLKDCPDGFDEENCVESCPSRSDFLCKDHRSCVSKSLVCDGGFHCLDGSDEADCPNEAQSASQNRVKCRLGSKPCRNGISCVLLSHVCDGERDCKDGSDEEGCDTVVIPATIPPTTPPCTSPSVLCPGSSICIKPTQICDRRRDCPDGSDEKCVKRCSSDTEFRCKDRRWCIPKSQVCNGRSQCNDGSDEANCPSPVAPATPTYVLKCRYGSRICRDRMACVLLRNICDGERDCPDGSDEEGCENTEGSGTSMVNELLSKSPVPTQGTKPPTKPPCTSPSVLCPGSFVCIQQIQMCDGKRDCPDGYDEKCLERCPSESDFLCKDRQSCVPKSQVCDGRSQCNGGSDEVGCQSEAPPAAPTKVLKCRLGSKLCGNGMSCVLLSHICDRERDCQDGSDEEGCDSESLNQSPTPTKDVTQPPTKPPCTSPSVLCPGSLICIKPTQMCDGKRDCPDGSDEKCLKRCPSDADFRCKDRRSCVPKSQVCDGRSQCNDGSDEIDCRAMAPPPAKTNTLKCRMGSRMCGDGTECVLSSHVCDGERDCGDGSDEEGCDVAETADEFSSPNKSFCSFPSVLCPDSNVCINPSQLCDGIRDCPDGSDENCVKKCADKTDFLCKDRRSCVSRSLVCDGRSHCYDASDEADCLTGTAPPFQPNILKCRMGSRPCNDGKECVLFSHICDGEMDCMDGSDEEGCQETCKYGEFQCAHGKMCIPEIEVCDGKPQCRDQSDEVDCWEQTKSCEHRCADGKRCIPKKFLCDGELDCLDGTDEQNCVPAPTDFPIVTSACISPSVMCPGSSWCISQYQLCDGQKDCPDGFDEMECIIQCENPEDFLCRDQRKCIPKTQVCDGRANCPDGSDEKRCQSELTSTSTLNTPNTRPGPLKCRTGFKMCKNGLECIMYSHVCDGERDCLDGSDEEGCEKRCKPGQFQCSHGSKCIQQEQVCDGQNDCQDRSDEMDCSKPSEGCHHLCDNKTRCIPKTFLCDGEKDCADGSDEDKCGLVTCALDQYRCESGQCISEAFKCDGYPDCHDHSDETGCVKAPRCPAQLRCPHSHECLQKEWLCDGEEDCKDGSDEKNCNNPPTKCRKYQFQCGDGGMCIPQSWRCDGKKDCNNGADEDKCTQRKCSYHLYQCDSKECLDTRLVCNGITNCADGSDEGMGCAQRNCSGPSAPTCDHSCVSTPNGPRCFCDAGFRLQSRSRSCVDIDECTSTATTSCKQICQNTRGSYNCLCHNGFYLEPDNKSCKTKDEPLLLASVQSEMLILGVHSGTLQLLSAADRPVFTLDYHWAEQRVYWLSPDHQSIRWADMKTKNKGTLTKGVKSDSIAVDWVGKNLYWLDGLVGQILAIKLNGSMVKSQDYTVVLGENLEQPSSLILIPEKGLMLWSEIGSIPQIERSGMDGSQRKVLMSQDLSWPVCLAYDFLDDRVYWADEKLRCIGSASLDGDDVKILQLTETPSPFSVAVFNDRVLWSDTKRRTVRSADKKTGKDQKVLLKRPGQPFGLKLMHALSQPAVSSPCDNVHCSDLCLLAPAATGKSRVGVPAENAAVCRCPKGLLLSQDRITCALPKESSFILLLSHNKMSQIYLRSMRRDGIALKKMPNGRDFDLPGVTDAMTLDLSMAESSVFVAYLRHGSVDVLKFSNSRSKPDLVPAGQILNLQDNSVTALAVDWVTSNLYWSSMERPDIHVTSRLDGYTTSLQQGSLIGVSSITLHPSSGRLCYSAIVIMGSRSQTEIHCAFMDGRNKVLLWKKSSIPISMVFANDGTRIYWADTNEGVIGSIGVDGSQYDEYKTGPHLLVSFTHIETLFLWVTRDKDVSKLWFSDGHQPKQLWFETKTGVMEIRSYNNETQSGNNLCSNANGGCVHLCLPYPGGRTCKCARGFYGANDTSCVPLPSCPTGEESCFDGSKCIGSNKFCDGRADCPDQSDEQDCPGSDSASLGTKVSGGQSWQSSSLQPNSQNSIVPNKDLASCDLQHCNGHGSCITEGKVIRCQCLPAYKGEFCQDQQRQSHPAVILVSFCLVSAVVVAAFVFTKRKGWEHFRSRSADKENLMSNMVLPGEDSDSEELESAIDVKRPLQTFK